jgi:uncharacterized membrane protein YedE/YeeE
MNWLSKQLQKELWSPYAAGVLLGLVGIATVVVSQKLLGASGGFENIAGMLGKAIAPSAFNNTYFNFVMPAQVTYAVVLLVGIFFGGMLGALSSKTFKFRTMDDPQWKQAYGPQLWKRWLLLFLGGIVVEYAAGIAGGCTSGLAISGGMLLAPAAFLFIMGMFASGILTAKIIYGKRY